MSSNNECKTIIVTQGMLLGALKRMKDRGVISVEQYATCLRRAKESAQKKSSAV